ncbi:hypothetical protein N7537_004948 [Penicillium hordei]|uniref:Uncharacterized protein n=1 Tax=Penicillium hordei TaxID=40994 RepID=A0AAD6ECQ1_9EURO|nr:uncharacterized protein N7537_004948 [Penicillium hordei]KAJ5608329.1 hypothetical protein N7537_004948 [Penicillium hordei]
MVKGMYEKFVIQICVRIYSFTSPEKGRTLGRKDYLRRTDVKQSPTAKLLGVVFDQGLRWKEHVQQAIKLATKTSIALNGLRHLRPEQMRQLYQACVTPVVGYASTIWHDPLRDKTHLRHLHTVQRTALVRILSAFRTVATTALEMEVHVLPTHLRLRRRAQRTIEQYRIMCTPSPGGSVEIHNVDRLNELETTGGRSTSRNSWASSTR